MTAYESGDSSQAAFSGQMAQNAYTLLGTLDADSHFHVGLLHQITGDTDAIVARADSIEALQPTHLFAPMLRFRAGRLSKDATMMEQGQREFLERFETEMVLARWEYDVHGRLIETFRREAESATGSQQ
jgi:YD repeat-containing protein